LDRLTKLVVGTVQGAASVIGCRVGTEEPSYRAEPLVGGVELRHYSPRLAAETTVTAGDREAALQAGFRRLAGYIFGGNHGGPGTAGGAGAARGRKIAMTAPVAQDGDPQRGWDVRFYLPAEWTRQTVPAPDDSRVRIVELPQQSVAVLRFSGDRGADALDRRTAQLQEALRAIGFEENGAPTAWFYDPPWTLPFLRRNEIAIPVDG
jgi:hypothetical protein